jgi:hypothetical protein
MRIVLSHPFRKSAAADGMDGAPGHPRSPKARDRGHPHLDMISREIVATRQLKRLRKLFPKIGAESVVTLKLPSVKNITKFELNFGYPSVYPSPLSTAPVLTILSYDPSARSKETDCRL